MIDDERKVFIILWTVGFWGILGLILVVLFWVDFFEPPRTYKGELTNPWGPSQNQLLRHQNQLIEEQNRLVARGGGPYGGDTKEDRH